MFPSFSRAFLLLNLRKIPAFCDFFPEKKIIFLLSILLTEYFAGMTMAFRQAPPPQPIPPAKMPLQTGSSYTVFLFRLPFFLLSAVMLPHNLSKIVTDSLSDFRPLMIQHVFNKNTIPLGRILYKYVRNSSD